MIFNTRRVLILIFCGGFSIKMQIMPHHKTDLYTDMDAIFNQVPNSCLENVQDDFKTNSTSFNLQQKTGKSLSESQANLSKQKMDEWPSIPPKKRKRGKNHSLYKDFYDLLNKHRKIHCFHNWQAGSITSNIQIKLLKPLPENRTYEQVLNHYLVEKAIAEKLKSSNREERKLIYATMYDELFKKVPDHSRIIQRENEQQTQIANKEKLCMVHRFLQPSSIFVEFAPGDCRFAMEVAKYVKITYAIDISDQRGQNNALPDNFNLIIYDGYNLDTIKEKSVDIIFSDQFIEHLHPDDTRLHFELAFKILKPGGKYIFCTPHAFTGPRDISNFFSNRPECFHLKEWTYFELVKLLKELNFSQVRTFRMVKNIPLALPYTFFQICEYLLNPFCQRFKNKLAHYLVPSILIAVTK
jgi:SAM-dependent methyltransferase